MHKEDFLFRVKPSQPIGSMQRNHKVALIGCELNCFSAFIIALIIFSEFILYCLKLIFPIWKSTGWRWTVVSRSSANSKRVYTLYCLYTYVYIKLRIDIYVCMCIWLSGIVGCSEKLAHLIDSSNGILMVCCYNQPLRGCRLTLASGARLPQSKLDNCWSCWWCQWSLWISFP